MMAMDATEGDMVEGEPSVRAAVDARPQQDERVIVSPRHRSFSLSSLLRKRRSPATGSSQSISTPTMEGVQHLQITQSQRGQAQGQSTLVQATKAMASDASNAPLFAPGQSKAYDTADIGYEQEIAQLKDQLHTAQINNDGDDTSDFFSSDEDR